ncbi:MAG: GGDEF domain-containing protein [Clostridiales Family XIII bacterium]|jgi:diguanylate cyclase (GGDEF)-like protein|nr:GGDEF domain-containing protein [Clostridiales Family XIII bacterium]
MDLLLRHENESIYRARCTRLLMAHWAAVAFVIVAESLLCISGHYKGGGPDGALFTFAVFPGAAYVLISGVASIISWRQLSRGRFLMQAYTFLTCVSLSCAVFTWVHYDLGAAYCVCAAAIMLSAIYCDFALLRFAAAFNMVIFALTFAVLAYFTRIRSGGLSIPLLDTAFIGVSAVCAASLLAYALLRRQRDLIGSLLGANGASGLDPLTKLFGHTVFYEHLDNNIMQCKNSGQGFCLIIIDIDDFQRINASLGREAGDAAVLMMVQAINEVIRETEEAFRYGGDEFAILTRLDGDGSLLCAEAIRTTFSLLTRDSRLYPAATASAGICAFDPAIFNGRREFFAAAGEALFEAKRRGKNASVLWPYKASGMFA